jgi:exodeoxyribonuclease-5
MELTNQQKEAKELILKWFQTFSETRKQVFLLSGYAGTGKTFLINYIMKELDLKDKDVAFGTPTGKAASVLIQRGRDASTIHRLIYTPIEEETQTKVGDAMVKGHKIKFVKRESIPNYKLIVLDEVSMVDENMMKDLLSFAVPILATGDPGQLPPIQGKNPLMENPDYFLTEIVRQSLDNPIIKLATMARNKEIIPYGDYGSVLVLNKKMISPKNMQKLLLRADQIICGTNSTRNYLNNEVRKMKGIDVIENPLPIEGDKIICTVNNWEKYLDEDEIYNLVNGTIGTVVKSRVIDRTLNIGRISFKPDFLENTITEEYVFDAGIFINDEFTYDMHQRIYSMPNGKYELKKFLSKKADNESIDDFRERVHKYVLTQRESEDEVQINRFEYASVISCHKSQGSEFDRVVLFDESYMFQDPEKWLYTGISRAKKKLVIIR